MPGTMSKVLTLAVVPLLTAFSWPYLPDTITSLPVKAQTYFGFPPPAVEVADLPYACAAQNYTTQIISLDPVVIYIQSFLSDADIAELLAAGEPYFKPSQITKAGKSLRDPQRTSNTAFLPRNNTAVSCVLERARQFAGALLDGKEGIEEMGTPQLVRYTEGQKFNPHYDWYRVPQELKDTKNPDKVKKWNRAASFFAILEDECEEGETWFPRIDTALPGLEEKPGNLWRRHPDGGIAFKPVKGNSLFWINLNKDGKGDENVWHAGLPLAGGRKTAMNIWPRRYYYD